MENNLFKDKSEKKQFIIQSLVAATIFIGIFLFIVL